MLSYSTEKYSISSSNREGTVLLKQYSSSGVVYMGSIESIVQMKHEDKGTKA